MKNNICSFVKKPVSCLFLMLLSIWITGCSSSNNAPSGLEAIYMQSQKEVFNNLLAPASAQFPKFDESFVSYDTSVLEDCGKGKLEYRIYDVKAYADSQNNFGALLRSNYWVKVYVYVDDYATPQFGEEGIHKGVKDHYYVQLMSIDD